MAARRVPAVAASSATLALVALAGRYGWHRDELYFLQCGRRLAWGFVDQPPLTPAIVRLTDLVSDASLVVIRVPAALAIGVVVLLAAGIARQMGGDDRAAAMAAVVTASTPLFLGMGHLVSTATFDLLMWTVVLWLVTRLLCGGDRRWWVAVGAAFGVGFLNKHTIATLGAALAVGFLLSPARRLLASRWTFVGAAIAAAVAAPNVVWHATHGWPVLDMLESLSAESGVEDQVLFVPAQFVQTGGAVVVWVAGLRWLLHRGEGERFRSIAVAYLVLGAVFVATGGKPYYLAGSYPALIAAGCVAWTARRPVRGTGIIAAVGVGAAVAIALPAIPASWQRHNPVEDLEYEVGAQLGWPEMVKVVAREARRLPAGDRESVAIYAQNYGEAGAIDLYGPEFGLPRAASPHNQYWWWGPPADEAVTLVVGVPDGRLDRLGFTACQRAHTFKPHLGVLSEESGRSLHVCRGHQRPWVEIWDDLRLYSA